MKILEKSKIFLAGAISATLVTGAVTAYTSSMKKTITVDYNNIKINVDGKAIEPKDGNGKSVEPFIYEGTTYLPVRAVSQALGKRVTWDGDTKTVNILSGMTESNMPKKKLSVWIMPNSAHPDYDFEEVAMPFFIDNPDFGLDITVMDWGSAWTKITAAATAGDAPDITQLGTTWVGAISYLDALVDLSGYINKDDFLPQTLRASRVEGSSQMTAAPWFAETRALYYRTDACEKARVDPTKDFETWDSFKAALKKLKNVEINGKKLSALGMPGKYDWNVVHNYAPWVYGAGGSFLNSNFTKSTFSSQETFEGIKFYSELANEGLIDKKSLELNTSDIESKFAFYGEYATSILGPWNIGSLENYKQEFEADPSEGNDLLDRVGVAMLPAGPKGRGGFLGGSTLSVFRSSKNQDKAIELIKFLTGKEAQIEYCKMTGNLPVVKAAYDDPWIAENPMRKVFKAQMEYAVHYPSIPTWGPIETYLQEGLSEVWDNVMGYEGKYSAEKTMKILEEADEKINIILETGPEYINGYIDDFDDYIDDIDIDSDNNLR